MEVLKAERTAFHSRLTHGYTVEPTHLPPSHPSAHAEPRPESHDRLQTGKRTKLHVHRLSFHLFPISSEFTYKLSLYPSSLHLVSCPDPLARANRVWCSEQHFMSHGGGGGGGRGFARPK